MSSLRPYPSELVGDDAYLDELDGHLEAERFPDPDANLIPELTKARFIAEAARAAGEEPFAEQVDARREPVFDPLMRFEVAGVLSDEHRREQLDETEIDELVSDVDVPKTISPGDGPEAFLSETLSQRELTFFDYPAPALDMIEAAASKGRELIDDAVEDRIETTPEQHRTYVQQRMIVEAVATGARDLAGSTYEDVIDRIHAQTPSEIRYENADEYANVVAFNAALAAESMLEEEGELTTPP